MGKGLELKKMELGFLRILKESLAVDKLMSVKSFILTIADEFLFEYDDEILEDLKEKYYAEDTYDAFFIWANKIINDIICTKRDTGEPLTEQMIVAIDERINNLKGKKMV